MELNGKRILVTGSPGFIGASLVIRLLRDVQPHVVVSLDNKNSYYDLKLKDYRLRLIEKTAKKEAIAHEFVQGDIEDQGLLQSLFADYQFDIVVNLAAQAGVRYSIDHPDAYIHSNVIGFYNILEACRHSYKNKKPGVQHFVYASSSSVYGGNRNVPFNEDDKVDHPVSLYAATKKSNELLAYSYSKLYGIPCTGLRFFTVYGPAGRPDMAYFSFTEKLRRGENIQVFNYGDCWRDFTYIEDIVEGIVKVLPSPPRKRDGQEGSSIPPHEIYNIGNSRPENLMKFVVILSEELVRAKVLPASFSIDEHIEKVPMQPGDVPVTYADTGKLERDFGYRPSTDLRTGLRKFAKWYREYYKV